MKYSAVPYPFCRECGVYFTYLSNWKRIYAHYSHTRISSRDIRTQTYTYARIYASIYKYICTHAHSIISIQLHGIKMKVEFVFERKYPFKSKRCISLKFSWSPDFMTFVLFKRCNEYKLIINLNWNTVETVHLSSCRRIKFALTRFQSISIPFILHYFSLIFS